MAFFAYYSFIIIGVPDKTPWGFLVAGGNLLTLPNPTNLPAIRHE